MITDAEIYHCGDCHIFDPDHQPSVMRDIENGWTPIIWPIRSGMTLGGPGFSIPLTSEMVACIKHEPVLIEERGHEGGAPYNPDDDSDPRNRRR